MKTCLALCAGALLLLWPAFGNGYPIVFSDTGAFLEQALYPWMYWDKPWVYGPLLALFHGRTTLWLPLLAQGLLVSQVLWMTQRTLGTATPLRHVLLCAALALGSAAPWFAALLMPDILAPLVVLCLFVFAIGEGRLGRVELAWAGGVAALGIAAHLAHLLIAAACLPVLWAARRRIALRPALPLLAAVAMLLAANLVAFGKLGISPYGSVFALARLEADGPARLYLDRNCPRAGYRLCAWAGRLPADSDDFLWDPDGPVWQGDFGPMRLAPEASRIVLGTALEFPLATLRSAAANTLRQLGMTRLGDTLVPPATDALADKLARYFPASEQGRYAASLQARGKLPAVATELRPWLAALLAAGAVATPLVLILALRRRDRALATLAALALAGVLANAAATGALSGPHDRYQARIAWLLVLVPSLALGVALRRPAWRPRPATSAPAPRIPAAASR